MTKLGSIDYDGDYLMCCGYPVTVGNVRDFPV
jgi:hypothetical protein